MDAPSPLKSNDNLKFPLLSWVGIAVCGLPTTPHVTAALRLTSTGVAAASANSVIPTVPHSETVGISLAMLYRSTSL